MIGRLFKMFAKCILVVFVILFLNLLYVQSDEDIIKFTEMAVESRDIAYCERIVHKANRSQCYLELNTPESCAKIDNFYYIGGDTADTYDDSEKIGECYWNLYDATKDEKYCVEMEAHKGLYEYVEFCFEQAGYSGNELCDKFVSDIDSFYRCYSSEPGAELNITTEHCRHFITVNPKKGYDCFVSLAVRHKDIKYCSIVEPYWEIMKFRCIISVALAKNDTNLCENIPTDCYHCSENEFCREPKPHHTGCENYADFCRRVVENGGYS